MYQEPCSSNNLKKISLFVVELFVWKLFVELHRIIPILENNKQVETRWILMYGKVEKTKLPQNKEPDEKSCFENLLSSFGAPEILRFFFQATPPIPNLQKIRINPEHSMEKTIGRPIPWKKQS